MKEIVEFLQQKNIIFKSFREIAPKEIASRKRVHLYVGVDLKAYYVLVMALEKRSRILQKEAKELMILHEKIEHYIDAKIRKKHLIIDAPLCSKAEAVLEEEGWSVWQEVLQ